MSVASGMHVAQLNVATMRYDADDPRMVDFMNGLDAVNAIAFPAPAPTTPTRRDITTTNHPSDAWTMVPSPAECAKR
ncbi:MAG: DUF3291 domain-containing protein, partial [Pseudomonadota bacterium]